MLSSNEFLLILLASPMDSLIQTTQSQSQAGLGPRWPAAAVCERLGGREAAHCSKMQ